jgi:simple sugar transport system substrate-binding protein
MKKYVGSVSAIALALMLSGSASSQDSGTVSKAVGGYSFEDAAKEAPGTKDFHSADGHLTFAIVTHTAGNGFFDPVYVGATVAGNMIGAKILLLGSESPTDDLAREIEILNQIIQDPTIDGLIRRPPQAGAYDDIVKAAEKNGIPVPRPIPSMAASITGLASAIPDRMRQRRRLPVRLLQSAWRIRVSQKA